jgi:hypothetical protein
MAFDVVSELGLTPSVKTDVYTLDSQSELEGKGSEVAVKTNLISATTAGSTDVLNVSNGFICKAGDSITISSNAGSEVVAVHDTVGPTATTITLASPTTLSHTVENSVVTANKIVANHDGSNYASGSLMHLPPQDLVTKAIPFVKVSESKPSNTDLIVFKRSGSVPTVDTDEIIAECHLKTQADFDAGTKNNVVSGADYIEPAFLVEPGVVSAYHFNNDLVDIYNAYNGTWHGSSSERYIAGKLNEAARFVGSNSDYISLPDSVSIDLGGASVAIFEGWIKRDETGSQVAIIDLTISSTYSKFYIDLYATGEVRVGGRATSSDSFQSCISSACTNDTNWHYLVAKLDLANSAITIWVDDVQVGYATGLDFGATTFSSSVGAGCRLGATAGNVRFLTGRLDEVVLYREDKTAAYFSERYNSGNGREIIKGYATSAVYTTRSFDFNTTAQASHIPDLVVAMGDIGSNCGLACKVRQDTVTPLTTAYSSATLIAGGTAGNNQIVVWQTSGMTDMRYAQVEITGTAPGNDTDKWQIRDIFVIPKPVGWTRLTQSETELNRYLQAVLLGTSDGNSTWEVDKIDTEVKYYYVDLYSAKTTSRRWDVKKIVMDSADTVHTIDIADNDSAYDRTQFVQKAETNTYTASTSDVVAHVRGNITAATPSGVTVTISCKNPIGIDFKWLSSVDPDVEVAKSGSGEDLIYSETISELNDRAGDNITSPSGPPWVRRWINACGTTNMKNIKMVCSGEGAQYLQASLTADFSSYTTFAPDGSVSLDITDVNSGGM